VRRQRSESGPDLLRDGLAEVIEESHGSPPRSSSRADTVIFMDFSTVAALWGVISCQIRYGPGQHGGGVHNRLNWTVLRYVATYRRRMRPRVIALIRDHASGAPVVVLRGRRATRNWIQQVTGP
jgi:hypothetical protein